MASFRKLRRTLLPFWPSGSTMRRVRERAIRWLGVTRTHAPTLLVARPEWRIDNMLRYLAAEVALRNGKITFLQIGAFDGVALDDLRVVIENYPTRGILVEPQPTAFRNLKENYRDYPQLTFVNGAIDRISGTRDFYTMHNQQSLVASFDRKHLLNHSVPINEITIEQVQCYSVADLLEQCGFPSIDLLQIDAEGYDFEIIKSIDFDTIQPSILRFEISHLSNREKNDCIRLLAGHGYRFLVEHKDVIAVHESSLAAGSTGRGGGRAEF